MSRKWTTYQPFYQEASFCAIERLTLALSLATPAAEARDLRTALDYWSNPPLGKDAQRRENDRAWDPLRGDRRYQQIWADERARIGPIHGELRLFSSW